VLGFGGRVKFIVGKTQAYSLKLVNLDVFPDRCIDYLQSFDEIENKILKNGNELQ
jgi:hypothetical protein